MKRSKKKLNKTAKNTELKLEASANDKNLPVDKKLGEKNIEKNKPEIINNLKNRQSLNKKNIYQDLLKFFISVKNEYPKIVWPKKNEVVSITIMVGIVSFFTSMFFMLTDYISYNIIDLIIMSKL